MICPLGARPRLMALGHPALALPRALRKGGRFCLSSCRIWDTRQNIFFRRLQKKEPTPSLAQRAGEGGGGGMRPGQFPWN